MRKHIPADPSGEIRSGARASRSSNGTIFSTVGIIPPLDLRGAFHVREYGHHRARRGIKLLIQANGYLICKPWVASVWKSVDSRTISDVPTRSGGRACIASELMSL